MQNKSLTTAFILSLLLTGTASIAMDEDEPQTAPKTYLKALLEGIEKDPEGNVSNNPAELQKDLETLSKSIVGSEDNKLALSKVQDAVEQGQVDEATREDFKKLIESVKITSPSSPEERKGFFSAINSLVAFLWKTSEKQLDESDKSAPAVSSPSDVKPDETQEEANVAPAETSHSSPWFSWLWASNEESKETPVDGQEVEENTEKAPETPVEEKIEKSSETPVEQKMETQNPPASEGSFSSYLKLWTWGASEKSEEETKPLAETPSGTDETKPSTKTPNNSEEDGGGTPETPKNEGK